MFDRIVVVDWSANNAPKTGADSIWVSDLDTRSGLQSTINHPTRARARDALTAIADAPGRTLIGFDFPFGYADGFADAAGFDRVSGRAAWEAAWQFLAAEVVDDEHNRSNRFRVAADLNRRIGTLQFWGAPPSQAGPHLTSTRPGTPQRPGGALPRFRRVEERLRAGGQHPFSAWQLLGAGSVGSQALTGIPVVHHLRHHPRLAHRARIWPFETGLMREPALEVADAIVLAEVWPSAIGFSHVDHPVKDARQVIALAQWLAGRDVDGSLAGDFAPDADADVTLEEGWVLGVP